MCWQAVQTEIAWAALGRGLNCSDPDSHGGELDESEKSFAELVVARCDAPELFEAIEEPLDVVALAINLLFPAVFLVPVRAVGNMSAGTL